jgi:hypothetical protein
MCSPRNRSTRRFAGCWPQCGFVCSRGGGRLTADRRLRRGKGGGGKGGCEGRGTRGIGGRGAGGSV